MGEVRPAADERPTLTTVDEYRGEAAVMVRATQLDYAGYTAARQRRIVADWVDLLSAGPTPITDLEFVSRTPGRLFAALAGQRQLERLTVKRATTRTSRRWPRWPGCGPWCCAAPRACGISRRSPGSGR